MSTPRTLTLAIAGVALLALTRAQGDRDLDVLLDALPSTWSVTKRS